MKTLMETIRLLTMILIITLPLSITAQNVGIGEPNPSEKLDVNGRIVAKGYKNTIYTTGGINSSTITLSSGSWNSVLTQNFSLDVATTVQSSYNFSCHNVDSGNNVREVITRLMIDGVEVDRMTSGGSATWVYFNNSNLYVTELASGSHTIQVQCKANVNGIQNRPATDEKHTRLLQVLVYGSN